MDFSIEDQSHIKLIPENEIFFPNYMLPGSPESLPYRKIWDISFFDNKAELVYLNNIAQAGPFFGAASAEKAEGIKLKYKNRSYKIILHPVIEYSLEFPYGRQARIWITTETACYRIMSVSANYVSYWQPFYDMVCFSGHVINILLNYRGQVRLVKLIMSIAKLSGKEPETTYNLLRQHRKFIFDLLKDQSLSAKIRKEYTTLQSNQSVWELDWSQHDPKYLRSSSGASASIFSFFKPVLPTENMDDSSLGSMDSASENQKFYFDEASSLLSISEDESATFIEYPNEIQQGFDVEMKEEEATPFCSLSTSFMKTHFLSLKLPDFTEIHSNFTCPFCNLTFNMIEKNSFSSFRVHIKAHMAELPNSLVDGNFESHCNFDFDTRFANFRSILRRIIEEKNAYKPISLKFEKRITCKSSENISVYKYPLFGLAESTIPNPCFNPISTSLNQSNISSNPPSLAKLKSTHKPRKSAKSSNTAVALSSAAATSTSLNVIESNQSLNQASFDPLTTTNNRTDTLSSITGKNTVSSSAVSDSNAVVNTEIGTLIASSTLTSFISTESAKSTDTNVGSILHKPGSIARILLPDNFDTLANEDVTPLKSKRLESKIDSSVQGDNICIPSKSMCPSPDDTSPNTLPPPLSLDVLQSFRTPNYQNFGCKHYSRNCLFFAKCCQKWFTCRFCHDEVSDHQVNCHETVHCICICCGTVQAASSKCCNPDCGTLLAKYYCDKCKFWDNSSSKKIYHCDKCKVCRRGDMQNSEHCDCCNKCVPKHLYSSHGCPVGDSGKKCVYCDELLSDIIRYTILNCCHLSHVSCKNRTKAPCPKCTPSLENPSIMEKTSSPLNARSIDCKSSTMPSDTPENINFKSPNQVPLKLVLKKENVFITPSPPVDIFNLNTKKVKMDQFEKFKSNILPTEDLSIKQPFTFSSPSSVTNSYSLPSNQMKYVDYLKNSLGNVQSLQKSSPVRPNVPSTLKSLTPIRTCWNCSKIVPDNSSHSPPSPSTQKYCFNCSAIL